MLETTGLPRAGKAKMLGRIEVTWGEDLQMQAKGRLVTGVHESRTPALPEGGKGIHYCTRKKGKEKEVITPP